jgi:hypothetical protein
LVTPQLSAQPLGNTKYYSNRKEREIIKTIRTYLLNSTLAYCLVFCGSSYSQGDTDSSYFPLAIGNKWVYESMNRIYTDTITVVDTQRVQGKLYYGVKEYSYRLYWFRMDNDKVYIVDTAAVRLDTSNIKEYILYDFTTSIGSKWYVPLKDYHLYCDYADTITLVSKSDVMTTSARIFFDCFSFLHDDPCRDAGRFLEWFAAGVGRVGYKRDNEYGVKDLFLTYSNITTGITENNNSHSTKEYMLLQNYPNPFNPSTNITFQLPESGFVVVDIFDALGRKIETLVNYNLDYGYHSFVWDASKQTSGVYFCKLHTKDFCQTIKLMLTR